MHYNDHFDRLALIYNRSSKALTLTKKDFDRDLEKETIPSMYDQNSNLDLCFYL